MENDNSKPIQRRSIFALLIAAIITPMAEAKGRKGSRRVGGSNSHGKGARYVGGRRRR